MKKFVTKLLSLILAGAVAVGTLAGCDLVTTNVDRDMAQVVAEIAIDDSFNEKIYKRQLVSGYNSYGYSYEAYYGYTSAQTYDLILTNLVENRIISQQARKALSSSTSLPGNETSYFSQAAAVADADKTSIDHVLSGVNYKGDAFTSLTPSSLPQEFLTKYEYESVRYSILVGVKSLIDSYGEEESNEVDPYETYSVTARASLTQPTTPSGNEYELKNDDEIKVIDEETIHSINKICKDADLTFNVANYDNKYDLFLAFYSLYNSEFGKFMTSKEGKSAMIKIVRALSKLGLISKEEASKSTPKTVEELFALSYYKDSLTTTYEDQVIAKYKLALQNQLEKGINKDTLYAEYLNLFNTQKANYESSNANYETALGESGEDTFVVYHPGNGYNGYGYIMNLLIGFNDMQTSLLEAYKAKNGVTTAEVETYRKNLVKGLTAKDQRASYIYNGYGEFDNATKEYTFKDTYVKTDALRKFNGVISGATPYKYYDEHGEPKTGYNYASIKATEVPFIDFYDNLVSSVMGFTGDTGELLTTKTETLDTATIEKFRDFIYAYSTDQGSLSENYGYVYSPLTSSKKYVKEFAAAAKRVVEKGAGAYEAVVTDYGVHVILCSKAIKGTGNVAIDKPVFEADLNVKDTLAYNFKKYKLELVVANEVSNKATSFIKTNKSKVTYHESAYADLVEGLEKDE